MTKDEIIRMAREAGVVRYDTAAILVDTIIAAEQKKWQDQTMVDIHEAVLEEREACAKVCEDEAENQYDNMDIPLTIAADLIRARGETSSRGQT